MEATKVKGGVAEQLRKLRSRVADLRREPNQSVISSRPCRVEQQAAQTTDHAL